jgi:hypothetical protein
MSLHVPARPLKLHPRFVAGRVFGVLMMAALGVGLGPWFAYRQYQGAMSLLRTSKVWQRGVPASSCSVDAKEATFKLVFHTYEFKVSYHDNRGEQHSGTCEVDTVFSTIDQNRRPVLRYLRETPDAFALSWAIEVQNSAWVAWAFFTATTVMFFCCIAVAVFLWNELHIAFLCSQKSDEVLLSVTKVSQEYQRVGHNLTVYHFEGENGRGQSLKGKVRFSERHGPLFANASKATIVALVSEQAPRKPVVLRCDLQPFSRPKKGDTAWHKGNG